MFILNRGFTGANKVIFLEGKSPTLKTFNNYT